MKCTLVTNVHTILTDISVTGIDFRCRFKSITKFLLKQAKLSFNLKANVHTIFFTAYPMKVREQYIYV